MRSVVADANVFVSFFVERNKAQQEAALAMLGAAEAGEIAGIIPQSVIFEIVYVLQSQYNLSSRQAAVTRFPALATTNRYDAVATFDRKLANKLQTFALVPYF